MVKTLVILQHEDIGSPGSIAVALRELEVPFEVRRLYLGDGLPECSREMSGVITLGGYMHATQASEFPFLAEEIRFLRDMLDSGMCAWGICLGAQLLTLAVGGRVLRLETPEVGWTLVEKTVDDPLLNQVPSAFFAFNWHEYSCHPPGDAGLVARCGDGAQVLRLGAKAWATQFHPEMDAKMAACWLPQATREYLGSDIAGATRLAADTKLHLPTYPALCRQLTRNFVMQGALLAE